MSWAGERISEAVRSVDCSQILELVTHAGLHAASRGVIAAVEHAAIRAEGGPIVGHAAYGPDIKARSVREIEYFPAKLQFMAFFVGHGPSLTQADINREISITTQIIALAAFSWVVEAEVIFIGGDWIFEHAGQQGADGGIPDDAIVVPS